MDRSQFPYGGVQVEGRDRVWGLVVLINFLCVKFTMDILLGYG